MNFRDETQVRVHEDTWQDLLYVLAGLIGFDVSLKFLYGLFTHNPNATKSIVWIMFEYFMHIPTRCMNK